MSDEPVYASAEDQAPDSAFAAGELRHLVVANRGRLLDARRTPITVVDVAPERGSFTVRVEAFEDAGARWELGLDEIRRFQFAHTAASAAGAGLAELRDSATRFDRDLSIERNQAARDDTLARLCRRRDDAAGWLAGRLPDVNLAGHVRRRDGHSELYGLLGRSSPRGTSTSTSAGSRRVS